jgi:hypothetical protein
LTSSAADRVLKEGRLEAVGVRMRKGEKEEERAMG